MNDWSEFQLGDLYDVSSGLSKAKEEFGFGSTFISFKDVFWNYFLPLKPIGRVNSNEKDQKNCSVNKGDILITRTSESLEEIGMTSVALKDYPCSTFNGFSKRLRIKKNSPIKVSPQYIGYLLRSRFFRKTVAGFATMTTRASLNSDSIKRIKLPFPDFIEQQEIGKTLHAFDHKIELLQAQNKILETMAQTIFKEWFGKYQIGDELPEGWRVGCLGDVAINHSKTYKFTDKKVVFVNTGDVLEGEFLHKNEISPVGLPGQAKKVIELHDILYSEIRPKNKRFAFVDFDTSNYVVSTKFMIIRTKLDFSPFILYHY